MGLFDLLYSITKAAVDYSQKNPQAAANVVNEIQKNNQYNKVSRCIDKYYLRKYVRDSIIGAHKFKVIDKDDRSITIEVYNDDNQLIRRTRCSGDSIAEYEIDQTYTF